jgi:hypothetical protein
MVEQIEQSQQILISGAETDGAFEILACTLPPYSPGYRLRRQDGPLTSCYVASGIIALTRGGATITLTAGELAVLRPEEVHRCWNPSSAPARLLLISPPGGEPAALERLMDEAADLVLRG